MLITIQSDTSNILPRDTSSTVLRMFFNSICSSCYKQSICAYRNVKVVGCTGYVKWFSNYGR